MKTIRLVTYDKNGKQWYVRDYDTKAKRLVATKSINDAKVYTSKAGAESSARSIYNNYMIEKLNTAFHLDPAFESVEYK